MPNSTWNNANEQLPVQHVVAYGNINAGRMSDPVRVLIADDPSSEVEYVMARVETLPNGTHRWMTCETNAKQVNVTHWKRL